MPETLDDPLLTADYRQAPGVYDEMCVEPGVLRPHWDRYIASLSSLGGKELAHRWQIARQRIRENGVSYNVYGDPLGTDRPWSLDAIPLLIPAAEWSYLEAGLIQRARLLNTILADLYGPQKLLLDGDLPSALVFGNPAFWRACHGVPVPRYHLPPFAGRRPGALARRPMVGDLRPHPGPFRRGLCPGKPHRHGGDLSRPLSRSPGAPAGWFFPRFSRDPAAPFSLARAPIRASCCSPPDR